MKRDALKCRANYRLALLLSGILSGLIIGTVAAQEYQLGPDDTLCISVLRHPELSAEQVVVTRDGKVHLPIIGEVAVTGLTATQAAENIMKALKVRLVSPEVTVSVKQSRPQRVFVLGSVEHAGVYDMQPGWRITEALAAAGGLSVRPELADGSILRLNRETISLDLPAILTEGNQEMNLILQPGDVLTVTERTIRVNVAGQVQKPGAYDVPIGGGAVEAVALAGGAMPKAALTRVTIKHTDGSIESADLFKAMVQGDMQANLKLRTGDLVMVPESKAKVAVLGAVRTPGYYDIEEGVTPKTTELIAMAGGPDKRARINQVAIMRMVDNQPQRLHVDLAKVLKQGKTDDDLVVKSGDVIYVPDAKMDWDLALRALASLGTFGWVVQ